MSTTFSPSDPVWKNATVLITGARGFIGQHLVRILEAAGANLILAQRTDLGENPDVALAAQSSVERFQKPVEYIFHLAGQKSAHLAKIHPRETLLQSLNGTIDLLEVARSTAAFKKLILISSLSVYDQFQTSDQDAYSESDPVSSASVYSATKISVESIGLSYARELDTPVTIARLANVYGPGQSAMAVIPSLIQQMKAGAELKLGNLQAVRDFIYVEDVVQGLLNLAQHPQTSGEVFNLGTGKGTSIQLVVEILAKALNFQGQIEVDSGKLRPQEKSVVVAEVEKMKRITGWVAQTTLEEGLKRTAHGQV